MAAARARSYPIRTGQTLIAMLYWRIFRTRAVVE
jgi:hypothetical protein